MRALRNALVSLALIVSFLPAAPGRAAAHRPSGVTEGTLWWRTVDREAPVPAPLLGTDVDIRVTGVVARALVHQSFTNPSRQWVEGVYVFPVPAPASITCGCASAIARSRA